MSGRRHGRELPTARPARGVDRVAAAVVAVTDGIRVLAGADEVVRPIATDASAAHRFVHGLLLRAAATRALGVPSTDEAAGRVHRWWSAAGARVEWLLGPESAAARRAEERLPDAARLAVDAACATGADLGALHEALLAIELRKVEVVSVRLHPGSPWVAVNDVLGEAPPLRSRRLQRLGNLPKSAVQRWADGLARATTEEDAIRLLLRDAPGAIVAMPGTVVVGAGAGRRRAGSHYTPPELAARVVERTLGPLVEGRTVEELLALRVCDPAMGSGAFLTAAATFLARRVVEARGGDAIPAEAAAPSHAPPLQAGPLRDAMRAVVTTCLRGVDVDPIAVDLAGFTLARLAWSHDEAPPDLSRALRRGNAVVGRTRPDTTVQPLPCDGFDWPRELPDVIDRRGGFDACVGNPPWVAYAGRAAQPLAPELARYHEATNPAFFGYRTLHGLFIRRAAELLRPGGRLGLVIPTSVADLAGYAPTRRAHDELCEVDAELIDLGNGAFEGVFQPCMALTSTRRATPRRAADAIWPLERPDLDAASLALLARLSALPKVPPELFGERGLQTAGADLAHLRTLDAPAAPFVVPVREGVDVGELEARPPRLFLDPAGLSSRLRPEQAWREVAVLVRQTARFPMAALSDGLPFRNSVLAAFATHGWSAGALVAYLNSSPVRWFHFVAHRDARQGMPQLKIGHLRALPAPESARALLALDDVGSRLGVRNRGMNADERAFLDDLASSALGLSTEERALVQRWAAAHPPPRPRRRTGNQSRPEPAPRTTHLVEGDLGLDDRQDET